MIILGIDPGSSRCGYGLIEKQGGKLNYLDAGLIENKEKNPSQKLFYLAKDFKKILAKTRPGLMAIEKIYFSKNVKTAIEVAQARGVLIMLALEKNLPISEHNPQEIKLSVTGYGLADKKAVAHMAAAILQISPLKIIDDASDALAVAITAANHHNFRGLTGI